MKQFSSIGDKEVANLLLAGKVGVMPTDTVYGIVCSAKIPQSVERLYKAKKRQGIPGTIISADIEQLIDLGIPRRYLTAVEQFWPGDISVELPHNAGYLHLGTGTIAVRTVRPSPLKKLLLKTGPLQTSSANITKQPTANTIEEAIEYFGETVDFYVDGGDLTGKLESTIIRIVDDEIIVLRDGPVKIDKNGRIIE